MAKASPYPTATPRRYTFITWAVVPTDGPPVRLRVPAAGRRPCNES